MSASPDSDTTEVLRRKIERLEILNAVSREVHSSLDLREVLQIVLADAVRWMRAQSGTVCMVNPTTGFLEVEAVLGLPAETAAMRLKVGEGITGWVARTGLPACVGDVQRDKRYVEVHPGVRSELAVPLRVMGQVRGVINVDATTEGAFTPSDVELLTELAAIAAPAIANTWFFEQSRLKARLFESLVHVGQIINNTLSVDDALQCITREARALLKAKMCSLTMLDESREWLDLRANSGAGAAYVLKPRLSVSDSFLGIVIRRQKPMQLENVQSSARYQNASLARREGLASLLSVPLMYAGRPTGTLNLYTGEPHTFSDEEVRVLSAYAELSALALEKARLYDRIVSVEEELRESERLSALGLLAAEIAHEIRNPLTVMKMLHHSLALDFPEGDPRRTDVRIMGEKMDHLNRIVDQVLDFARSTEPQIVDVDINQLLDDLGLLTRHKLRAQDIQLVRQLQPDLSRVAGDPTQLEQAFLNLTLNAVEAMPKGGRLSVRSRSFRSRGTGPGSRPSHVVVRFRDTGVGMSEERRRRAFSSMLSTTKAKGTGLGLAIVARVVEQHHGSVRVWSTPGKGTTFLVVIPVER